MSSANPLQSSDISLDNYGKSLDSNSSMRNIAYWESTLFSSVYLKNDLKRDFSEKWERDFEDVVYDANGDTVKKGFYHFYNEFRNIANSLRGLSQKKLSETDTITKIIVPLLDALGWYDNCTNNVEEPYAAETSFTVKAKPKNKTYRTDMILVDAAQEASYIGDSDDPEKRKKEARQYCIAPLEAKYWNRIADREKSNLGEDKKRANRDCDDTGASNSFNEQILTYMDILHRKWGILTDGNIWRLLNSEISGEAPSRCFEFRIESLLDQEEKIESGQSDEAEFMENAKYFYLFFGKASYVKDDLGKIFLDEVLKESRKYIDSIEEDLKDRFISAMNIACDGLLRAAQSKGTIKKPTDDELKLIRTVAESHLFNILFIKSCEARSILPIKSPSYYEISLTGIFDRISVFEPEKYVTKTEKEYIDKKLSSSLKIHNYKPSGLSLYNNLIRLTDVIHLGANGDAYGFEIKGFKESVFSNEEWSFAKKHCLTDQEMVKIFFELGYTRANAAIQRNYQQIPYNYFTPRQLGSIYESFLEFKLEIAKDSMVYVQKGTKKKYRQWVKLTASLQKGLKGHEPIVKSGQVFFTPDNSERKATGSYYTPDYVVKYMVKQTLGPICMGKRSDEILKIEVCDPAMGSGHFLIGALDFLTDVYVRALEDELQASEIPSKAEAKRAVLDKCIFGVDFNPRAVKLARLSLWLESAHWGQKLERLDDQLKCGDSIFEKSKSAFSWKEFLKSKGIEQFDAIIGNPPYFNVDEQYGYASSEGKYLKTMFADVYQDKTDIMFYFCDLGVRYSKTFAYILKRTFLEADKGQKLRSKISSSCTVREIVDFGDYEVFWPEAAINSAILMCDVPNTKGDGSFRVAIAKECERDDGKYGKEILSYIGSGEHSENVAVIECKSRDLSGKPWTFQNKEDKKVKATLESNSVLMSSLFDVAQGMSTGANHIYGGWTDSKLKKEKIPSGLCRKLIKNSDIHPYHIEYDDSYTIYLENIEDFAKLPSSVQAVLNAHKAYLLDRSTVKNEGHAWFHYNRALGKKWYDAELDRLIVPYRASHSRFAFIPNGEHMSYTDTTVMFPKFKDRKKLISILAILNSSVMEYLYQWIGKPTGAGMREYFKTNISNIPVRIFEEAQQNQLYELLWPYISKGKPVPQDVSERANQLVIKFYGISKSELIAA